MSRTSLPVVLLLLTAACAADSADGDPAEPTVEPEACGEETPTVTWETFGEGFVTTHCQNCHASTSPDRKGAPDDVIFDTKEDVAAWSDLMLASTTSDPPRMPPAGGPSDEDRELVAIWLGCFTGE